ncbi:MAG: hypothetical protein AAF389_07005 [Gemmatimonadota bacterium]
MNERLLSSSLRFTFAMTAAFAAGACGSGDAADGDVGSTGDEAAGTALGAPTASFPEDFGAILAVRELSDGTVLVPDPLGGVLFQVDMDAGTREQIGAEGQGPEEYRQPDAVWTLPGDSTLLVDLGNGRMTALTPDLSFGETSPMSAGDPRTGMIIAIPQGVDDEGRVYSRSISMSMGPGNESPDSGAVLRVTRGSLAVDTAAMFKLQDRIVETSGGPNNQNVSVRPVFLSPEDAWGVAPDGAVVMARSSDYSIEWHAVDGAVTKGQPTPYDVVQLGTDEKLEFLRARSTSGGGIGISVTMDNNQSMQMSFGRGGAGRTQNEENPDDYTWPEVKPPFYSERIPVDPMSRAWVRRHVEAGEPSTYDLFDRSGDRVATYLLPHGERVIGFGAGTLYVVVADEFDLNYLRRYTLPS